MTLTGDDLVSAARALATERHRSQADKAGQPYIAHPARVALRVASFGPVHEAVAWLHDTVEDTGETPETLARAGYPADVVAGVVAMTKQPGDGATGAVRRACADPVALVVKAADVADNTDPQRLALVPEPKRSELREKYRLYAEVLAEHGAPTLPEHVDLDDATLVAIELG